MRNRIVKVTEVVVRSAFLQSSQTMYLLAWDYHFILNGFQFYFCFQWYGSTIDYGKSINEIIEKKVIAEILCICCIALSIAMAYFVGYIQGAFVSL